MLHIALTIPLLLNAGVCPPDCETKSAETVDEPTQILYSVVPNYPLAQDTKTQESKSESRSTVVITNENGTVKVERVNGEYTVWHDGEKLDESRYTVTADKLIVKDEAGETLYTFAVTPGGISFGDSESAALRARAMTIRHQDPEAVAAIMRPRGRIGITMKPLDPALRDQLGIEDQGAFLISAVVEGGPAAKAGLRQHDIIIRINGDSATQTLLRKSVNDTDPGEEVTLRIIRKGQPKDVAVTVEKADPADDLLLWAEPVEVDEPRIRLRSRSEARQRPHSESHSNSDSDSDSDLDHDFDFDFEFAPYLEGEMNVHLDRERLHRLLEQARQAQVNAEAIYLEHMEHLLSEQGRREVIEKAIKKIQEVEMDEEVRATVEESLRQALDGVEIAARHLVPGKAPRPPHFVEIVPMPAGKDRHVMVMPPDAPGSPAAGQARVAPRSAGPSTSPDRLRALEERLARVEKLLERLADRLEDNHDDDDDEHEDHDRLF